MTDSEILQPWYRTLNRTQWNTLLASNLGWVFDGFEAYALILTVSVALHQLLRPADRKSTRLNSSHQIISYAVFCLKKKKRQHFIVNGSERSTTCPSSA